LDSCPETTYKFNDPNRGYICINKCYFIINGNECVSTCNGYVYDDNTCKSTCPYFYDEHNFVNNLNWVVKSFSSQNTRSRDYANNVKDGNPNTMWHTQYNNGLKRYPHYITLDMGQTFNVSQFRYLTRKNGVNGMVKDFEFYLSLDGTNWFTPIKGRFGNTHNWQWLTLSPQRVFRYFRFKTLSEVRGGAWTSAA